MGTARSDVLDLAGRLAAGGEDYCLVTVVRTADATSAKAGAKAIVARDGTLTGFVGGGCVTGATRRAALEALAHGAPRLIRVRPKDQVVAKVDVDGIELHASSCPSGGTVELFLEPVRRAPRLVVTGASPIAAAIVTIGRALGHHVVAAALAEDHGRLPAADAVLDGFDLAPLALDGRDAVVVATQGKRDREALAAALLSEAGYVGMVGSRRKIATLTAQIADRVPADRLARLHGPAGLDIGAIEPEEIALAILAELVRERRKGVVDDSALAVQGKLQMSL